MNTRRSLLLGLAGSAFRVRAASRNSLDFVHLSDTHVINPAGVHPKALEKRSIFAHTRAALPRDLAALHRDLKAEFAFLTGDLIDVYSFKGAEVEMATGQVEAFAAILRDSPLPVFPGLGNHDVQHYGLTAANHLAPDQSFVEQAKAAWVRNVPAFKEGTYYAFQREVGGTRWRFIMLNNGFYGHLPEPVKREPQYGLGRGQADWFAAECRRYPHDPLVVGMHIPPRDGALAEVEQALGRRKALTLILTGHTHTTDHVRDLPFSAAKAVEIATPAYATGAEHFRRIRLFSDRVEVSPSGRSGGASRSIAIEG